jgi:tRNA(Ile2) C34 agmatinyltransferase TiaS
MELKTPLEVQRVRTRLSPSGEETAKTQSTETARMVNDEHGVCPSCRNPMEQAISNGIQVFTCLKCRAALPVPDNYR